MQEQLNNIERSVGEILGELKGINNRLDTVNGRLGKHDEAIASLISQNSDRKMEISNIRIHFAIYSAGIGVVAMALLQILLEFLQKHF